jgi:pimeloyl-ACP methyl ester carboxylesterase
VTSPDPFESPDFNAIADSRQEVSYFSEGDPIDAWYFCPHGVDHDPLPAVVVCPGFTGTKQAGSHPLFIPGLVAAGYAVLLIDYRGWGTSGGRAGLIDPHLQVEDVRNALSYLSSRRDVDQERLGLFGLSFGGNVACFAASIDERIKVAISVLGGVADGASWLRSIRREYEWFSFLETVAESRIERAVSGEDRMVDPTEDLMVSSPERRALRGTGSSVQTPFSSADALLSFKPVDMVHRIAPRAVLWFSALQDPVVQYEQCLLLYRAAREPKKLVALPAKDHYGAFVRHQECILRESLDWLAVHLHPEGVRSFSEPH